MILSRRTYTLQEVNRLVEIGMMINGMPVDETLMNIDGVSFRIIWHPPEASLDQLKGAENWIRDQRDVVGPIYYCLMERCPNCGSTEEEAGGFAAIYDHYDLSCNNCRHEWASENYHELGRNEPDPG